MMRSTSESPSLTDATSASPSLTEAPFASPSLAEATSASPSLTDDDEEETFTTPAGLARLATTLEMAANLVDINAPDKLKSLLRSPIFQRFVGYEASEETSKQKQAADVQLLLVLSFPSKSRKIAAVALGQFISDLRAVDAAATQALQARQPKGEMVALLDDARSRLKEVTVAYYADGCLVCPDQVSAGRQSELDDRMLKLKQKEEALKANRLRRPDERDEQVARALGFREGELIGGY